MPTNIVASISVPVVAKPPVTTGLQNLPATSRVLKITDKFVGNIEPATAVSAKKIDGLFNEIENAILAIEKSANQAVEAIYAEPSTLVGSTENAHKTSKSTKIQQKYDEGKKLLLARFLRDIIEQARNQKGSVKQTFNLRFDPQTRKHCVTVGNTQSDVFNSKRDIGRDLFVHNLNGKKVDVIAHEIRGDGFKFRSNVSISFKAKIPTDYTRVALLETKEDAESLIDLANQFSTVFLEKLNEVISNTEFLDSNDQISINFNIRNMLRRVLNGVESRKL